MPSQKPNFPIPLNSEYDCPVEQATQKEKPGPLTVTTPSDPPELNPAAARTLLRILLTARQRLSHPQSEES